MAEAAPTEKATPEPPASEEESRGPKIKQRRPKQRACDEKNPKGKLCMGHLKRWFDYPADIEEQFGAGAEIYHCERCQTIYMPDSNELPRSYTLRY